MTEEPPPELIDWQGQRVDAGLRAHRGASERALHRADQPVPVARPGLGEPAGRADQGVHLRRAAPRHRAARLPGVQLDPRRLPRRDDGLGDDRRRRRRGRRRCGATRWRCCRSAATTWPTTSTTGCSSAARSPTRRASSASTGSAATRTASSSGRASARTCASCNGSSSARTAGAVGIESPLGWMPRYEDLDWRGLEDFPRERFDELMSIDRDLWAQEILVARGAVHQPLRPAAEGDDLRPRADPLRALPLAGALAGRRRQRGLEA